MLRLYHSIHTVHRILFLSSVLFVSIGAFLYYVYPLQVIEISPANQTTVSIETKRIAFHFNRPIARQNVQAVIEPDLPGEWKFEDPLIGDHLYQTLVFVPYQTLRPGTKYQFHAGTIRAIASARPLPINPLEFQTEVLPTVLSDTVSNDDPLSVTSPLVFTFTRPVPAGVVEFTAAAEPSARFETVLSEDRKQLTLNPTPELEHSTTYQVALFRSFIEKDREGITLRTHDPENIYTVAFHTVTFAGVEDILPKGNTVLPDETVKITFTKPMNRSSVEAGVKIEPEYSRAVKWIDDTHVEISASNPLSYATAYAVKLSETILAKDGSHLPAPIQHSFSTLGAVNLRETAPKQSAQGISISSTVKLSWNQDIDQSSLEKRITISPKVSFLINKESNSTYKMSFASKLAFDTLYTIHIDAGVASAKGAPGSPVISFSFVTEPEVFKINIPLDYQDKKLSCEAAALKMALVGKGVKISETAIMNIVGYDPTKKSKGVWGDPYQAFVGDINGRQNSTGYGVYWDPIAKAAKNWRSMSESFTNWTVEKAVAEIAKGNPIVIWGTLGPAYRDDWKTPSGKQILAWKGEHARTLVGFIGSRENPQTLIINDPIAGILYWSKATFLANWKRFNNSGVVVR